LNIELRVYDFLFSGNSLRKMDLSKLSVTELRNLFIHNKSIARNPAIHRNPKYKEFCVSIMNLDSEYIKYCSGEGLEHVKEVFAPILLVKDINFISELPSEAISLYHVLITQLLDTSDYLKPESAFKFIQNYYKEYPDLVSRITKKLRNEMNVVDTQLEIMELWIEHIIPKYPYLLRYFKHPKFDELIRFNPAYVPYAGRINSGHVTKINLDAVLQALIAGDIETTYCGLNLSNDPEVSYHLLPMISNFPGMTITKRYKFWREYFMFKKIKASKMFILKTALFA